MSSRLIMFFISLLSLVFIISLIHSINALWQKGSIISERETILAERDREHQELEQKLAQVQSQEFIEEQAREKLNLSREGEIVVVLPQNVLSAQTTISTQPQIPNWRQWWNLFF